MTALRVSWSWITMLMGFVCRSVYVHGRDRKQVECRHAVRNHGEEWNGRRRPDCSSCKEAILISLAIAVMFLVMSLAATAQSIEHVPGVVVSQEPVPSLLSRLLGRATYTASPSIVVLPGGDYVLTHNIFGPGSGADVSGTTKVFRSSDKGATWTHLTTLTDMKRGSLFVHDGSLYIFGYRNNNGDILIRRSDDGGRTWTTPTDTVTGVLRVGNFGGTPSNPVVFDGRIWIPQGGKRIMSASVDSDLLRADSWILSNTANTNSGPLGDNLTITEAQIVASPRTGVIILPKVGGRPNTVLIRSGASPDAVLHPNLDDWIDLPGGEKKFGAAYDPVSDRFYILSNPVLPVHEGADKPELIRNTAALLSSYDLKHWDVMQIFLYSPNVGYEAFQYFNFDFDGDDMVIASRTAFDVGGRRPPRGHDSNLITFHRISDFRSARPDHVLVLDTDNDRVLRYELTQHAMAPLGQFTLGTVFAGRTLTRPVGIGQDADGTVYIQEASGRILRFDALGNFLEAVSASPVAMHAGPLRIQQPAHGERGWIRSGSGAWKDLTNWYYWNRPDTAYEIANFGSAAEADSTVTLDENITLKGLRFRSGYVYTISGPGRIELAADEGRAILDLQLGKHRIDVPIILGTDLDVSGTDAGSLSIEGSLDLNGHAMHVTGRAELRINGDFRMSNGNFVLYGEARVAFGPETKAELDGSLEFVPVDIQALEPGVSFILIEGIEHVRTRFKSLLLPELPHGWRWDIDMFYRNGTVRIAAE